MFLNLKSTLRLIGVGLILSTTPACAEEEKPPPMIIEKGDRIAIVGDSITEQKLYSKFIETYLLACTPQLETRVFQFGWGGERAPGFAARQENDLAFWTPDVITTSFGMNDGRYTEFKEKNGDAYEAGMRAIIDRFTKDGVAFVIGGPGVVDSENFNKDEPEFDTIYNDTLKQMDRIAARIAAENEFPHAEVYDMMMDVMTRAKAKYGEEHPVAGTDGIHPGANGHLVMAYAYLKALGMNGAIAEIRMDLDSQKTATSEGHQVVESTNAGSTVVIESSRYPFCFYGEENDPDGTVEVLQFLPFNEELNRFTLIVKNLPGLRGEVQWGDAKKTFTREELAEGINLAGEFITNPFSEAFAATMNSVAEKQTFETPMIKDLINKFQVYEALLPNDTEITEATVMLREKLIAKDDELFSAAKATVNPIRHTITVKALDANQ